MVRTVQDDDRLAADVIGRIGDPARDLDGDPATKLVAVAESMADGAAAAGLLARRLDRWELRTTPGGDPGEVVAALISHVAHNGGGPVSWFTPAVTDNDGRAASRSGLAPTRRLFQMRCPLPFAHQATISVRSYEPERDRAPWVVVNNRAFDGHPDQGGWSEDDLREREQEPWFDPAGFLLHEVDGQLAAFCWTKVHAAHEPPLGEIYVIAVDPAFRGAGLGREMTLAGLDHLTDRGLDIGMLYVDDDNEAGLDLYQQLGFQTHHADIFFTGTI